MPGQYRPNRQGRDGQGRGRSERRETQETKETQETQDAQEQHEQAGARGVPWYVGIDVSKARLDRAVRPGREAWQSANDEAGSAVLGERLQSHQPQAPQLIVLEATGGLERLVVATLALASLPVAVVNPRQARDFAKATGHLARAGQDRCRGCRGARTLC